MLRQAAPAYLTNRKNTIIQIAFTTVFAYIFINIYRPFGYENWYKIQEWQLLIASAAVVLGGMVVILLSRLILLRLKRHYEITLAMYIWFIVAEIIFMGGFYTSLEIFILDDQRSPLALMFNAVQNTALILLIPYTLSILFFAWSEIKEKFEQLVKQFRNPNEIFIPFNDEKGNLRLTVKVIDLLFLEANDNYVNIHYMDGEKRKLFMVRNTLKKFEKELDDYPLCRIHRRFTVNIINVKLMKKVKTAYEIHIKTRQTDILPVSKSYEPKIMNLLNRK